MAEEADKCKRFEKGLRSEIRTPVTASTEWMDFVKLVEAAMRVEKSLAGEGADRSGNRTWTDSQFISGADLSRKGTTFCTRSL